MENVIVCFAPSPTGYLHIGGARTAVFNWLFARKHGGKFILRIEDTDEERSTADSIDGILEGLRWLGVEWDEGPNFQSLYIGDHVSAARRLMGNGRAYKCFCDKEMLEEKREAAIAEKRSYQYDGTCRRLTPAEVAAHEAAEKPYVIRLKVPEGEGAVIFEDAVYGRIEKQYCDIEDFVILRANGRPLYILSNTVDDIRDGITHIIRGQDGLANTPKQILIYQGLDAKPPTFAHMSLTLDPQKTKISKCRHGELVAIHYYRKLGFLPWAMVNFLVLLGWSTADSRQFFSPKELLEAFDLSGINRTNSIFNIHVDDPQYVTDPKLLSINAHYLRGMALEELLPIVEKQLRGNGLWDDAYAGNRAEWFRKTVQLIRARYHVLTDFATQGRAYFSDAYPFDPAAVEKHLGPQGERPQWLTRLSRAIENLPEFNRTTIEKCLHAFLEAERLKAGQLMNTVRVTLTGQGTGPEFMAVLECLGRKRVIERLGKNKT